MKTKIAVLSLTFGLTTWAMAQSSGGSPGSTGANNGGFSRPPITVPATPPPAVPSAPQPGSTPGSPNGASGVGNLNPNINGSTPGATNGEAFNGNTNSAFNGSTNFVQGNTNFNQGNTNFNSGSNPGQNFNSGFQGGTATSAASRMNSAGDVTNANGTISYNTNTPHWWEKQ